MSSIWGHALKISVFGESHGEAIGVVIDGFPHGIEVDMEKVLHQMARRAPGGQGVTKRKEKDLPRIVSGMYQGITTGAPLCALFENTDTRSSDYKDFSDLPRPSHADWTGRVRFGGFNDFRGGGHFSGRLTAPLVFAGALARQVLLGRGLTLGGRLVQIGHVIDESAPLYSSALLNDLASKRFSALSEKAEQDMRQAVLEAQQAGDSLGGVVEIAACGIPAGWGKPMLETLEGRMAHLVFGVPGVRGIEFGTGFALSAMRGSQANDPFIPTHPLSTSSNNSGGVNGGITNGMPIVFRVAFRPTASIVLEQQTVRLSTGEAENLVINGRHDPCIAVRAVPVLEAVAAIVLLDLALEMEGITCWTSAQF